MLRDPSPAAGGALHVVDRRSAAEVAFNSRCVAVPGREIGEAAFSPARLDVLSQRLERALSVTDAGKVVTVHRFQVCVESNGIKAAALAGVSYSAAVLADASTERGVDVASIDLDVEIDGRRYTSRVAHNCHLGYVTTYAEESESVRNAIWQSLDAAVGEIAERVAAEGGRG
jgi:hypothetical protein